jgi:lipopolysaccharide assembly protein A
MQIFRTVVWVVLLIALLLFSVNNWTTVNVKIWENLILETKLPALVVVSFLLGLVPMWLAYLAGRWRYTRRINALENSVRVAEPPPAEAEAAPTSHSKTDPAASDPVYPTSP